MKIICKKTTAKGLDLKEVTTLLLDKYDYGLELEKEYIVMGIATNKDNNCLYYLIDENCRPDWFPYMLFEVSDNTIPKNWYIDLIGKKGMGDIFWVMGFSELCNDENFHDLLIERDETAMRTYFRRKIELEKELAENKFY